MAVDTRNKRAAALLYAFLAGRPLPNPDGTVDANDRIQLAGNYPLAASPPPPPAPLSALNLLDRWMAALVDAGDGTPCLQVIVRTGGSGTVVSNLNDRWYEAFVDSGDGTPALQVVLVAGGLADIGGSLNDRQFAAFVDAGDGTPALKVKVVT